ncbi:S-DNA-T family DNA segregation ATPase FtsK/SpoIIIE OS=Streptomyces albaduncus OX=68172 GN=FHS32_000247 PE=4 SV=1 [Streptomyces griseoloalbus]
MTLSIVHRPARSTRPAEPVEPRQVEAPPNLPDGKIGNAATALLPMAGVMGSVIMMTVIRNSRFAVVGAVVLVFALIGAVALFLSQRGKAQRTRRTQRERYLEYLEEMREELGTAEQRLRDAERELNPSPDALYDVVRDPARLWERRRQDSDFLRVRVGLGDVPVQGPVIQQSGSGGVLTPPDPFMLNEARALQRRFSTVTDMPVTVPLDRAADVSVIGSREDVLKVARALLVQTAVTHAPDDVALALAVPGERQADWEWAKWLPHVLDPGAHDGPVPARRIAPDPRQLAGGLRHELGRRAVYAAEVRRGLADRNALRLASRMLVIVDGHGEPAVELPRPDSAVGPADMGVTVVHLLEEQVHEPDEVSVRITVHGDRVTVENLRATVATEPSADGLGSAVAEGTVDPVAPSFAEGVARMLAPLRLSPESVAEGSPVTGPVDFPLLLGITDPSDLDLSVLWKPRTERDFLRVPIGLTDRHEPVLLDLKESSQLGMGPHGLCVGATGSGKSELLRTLVLALAATHPPEDLALVLVDYKGGATFAPFAGLPHTAGMITNLENQAGLVERIHASLAGEVKRRQQVLKDAGDVPDIGHYAELRATTRPDLEPLPHLFVVIDEFGELLTAKPDFIDLFLSVGRIGRSIGVHLLLSSQRIESGKLKGLDALLVPARPAHLLRRRVPHRPRHDGRLHLRPLPGFGYLKVDTSTYGNSPPGTSPAPRTARPRWNSSQQPLVLPYPVFKTQERAESAEEEPATARKGTGPTVLSLMVDRLTDAAPAVRRIWLPPLPDAVTLDAAAGPTQVSEHGLHLARATAGMRVPLGVLDDPARQWQGQWVLDLTSAGGHAQ